MGHGPISHTLHALLDGPCASGFWSPLCPSSPGQHLACGGVLAMPFTEQTSPVSFCWVRAERAWQGGPSPPHLLGPARNTAAGGSLPKRSRSSRPLLADGGSRPGADCPHWGPRVRAGASVLYRTTVGCTKGCRVRLREVSAPGAALGPPPPGRCSTGGSGSRGADDIPTGLSP